MAETAGIQQVYVETNVFIKAVGGTEEASAPAKELLNALRTQSGLAVTSEITLAEVLAPPSRHDALPVHIKRRVYLDLLIWSGFVNLVPVSRDILIETADLRTVAKLKLPDAIHLVSAINSRCQYFVSGDSDFKQLPLGMSLVKPDEEGISGLSKVLL